jgi:hypothetical protein
MVWYMHGWDLEEKRSNGYGRSGWCMASGIFLQGISKHGSSVESEDVDVSSSVHLRYGLPFSQHVLSYAHCFLELAHEEASFSDGPEVFHNTRQPHRACSYRCLDVYKISGTHSSSIFKSVKLPYAPTARPTPHPPHTSPPVPPKQ